MFEPPLFVFSDTVDSFSTVDAMLRYIEPWDVTEDMRAFDSHGRTIVIRCEGVVRTRWTVGGRHARTFIDVAASGDEQPAALATLLCEFVTGVGLPSAPLEQLVSAAVERLGFAA